MYLHEIALLVAVATPIIVVVVIDLYLAFHGETENLLLPRMLAYPSQPIQQEPAREAVVQLPVEEPQMEPLRKAA
jgi:hypothetical protein